VRTGVNAIRDVGARPRFRLRLDVGQRRTPFRRLADVVFFGGEVDFFK
jgi:hypothetical protein